jgi:hypothetical protein
MAEYKRGMGVVLGTIGAMLGFFVFAAEGCQGACSCPPPDNEARIHLGCIPTTPPVVMTTGPCAVCPVLLANGQIPPGAPCAVPADSQDITLAASGAGTCHVELTFGNGATSSVDLDFTSQSISCGSDPKGCGEELLAADQSAPDPTCAAGPDAEPSE